MVVTPKLSISGETASGQEDGAPSSDPGLPEEVSPHSRTHTLGEAPPTGTKKSLNVHLWVSVL